MNRFLAAILFCLWTLCYAHCAAAALGEGTCKEDACCQHEQSAGEEEPVQDAPCGICDAILSGGLLLVKESFSVAALLLMALASAFVVLTRIVAAFALRHPASPPFAWRCSDPPWRVFRLSEFLARTACPVRGPALLAA